MDWQLPLTLLVIASAGGYLAWRGWRSWRARRKGCGGGCSCHEAPADNDKRDEAGLIPAEQLTVRRPRTR